jgi:mannose-6-phosphate isomerase
MPATQLATTRVEKPWGRHHLYPGFSDPAPDGQPVGEVWFQMPDGSEPELLIKYLFTSDRLSVQDHPDDADAKKEGYPRGKSECWLILEAEEGATIAMGTKEPTTKEALRAAALDGSIVDMLDWKPVKKGEFYYSPAGTIHAIGAGITVIETQQNVDLTYRLYDYGSDRELHLDKGLAIADPNPFTPAPIVGEVEPGRTLLVEGPKFVLERWSGGERKLSLPDGLMGWLVPVTGEGAVGGVAWKAGECVVVTGEADLHASVDSDLLFAYPGTKRIDGIGTAK